MPPKIYTSNLLKQVITRDKCVIEEIPDHLNGKIIISFKCVCGTKDTKTFERL